VPFRRSVSNPGSGTSDPPCSRGISCFVAVHQSVRFTARDEMAVAVPGLPDVAGAGFHVDRSLDLIPGALDPDDTGGEVDVGPVESSEFSAAQSAEQRDRPECLSLSGSEASNSCTTSGGSIRSRRPRIAGRSRLSVGSIEISSRRIARRKMTRSGSRMFAMVEGEGPGWRSSSTKSWTSRRWICDTFHLPSTAGTTYERSSCS
jgi:hypothetical protein